MKIGTIGAGNIGATLARKLATSGNDVKLANSKDPISWIVIPLHHWSNSHLILSAFHNASFCELRWHN
jgi:glycerol-3-phosphate dehydrogenase